MGRVPSSDASDSRVKVWHNAPGERMDIERHIRLSEKLRYEDLDWDEARRQGLSEAEQIILQYIADVEAQTIHYMKEMLESGIGKRDDALTFLTIWNYEEFFHAHAVAKLLRACGVPLAPDRREALRAGVDLRVKAEAAVQWCLGRVAPTSFCALYFAWAASQEFLTKMAYEELAASTNNSVLREICLRIAKQERRHFAWYFNSARLELESSSVARRIVRLVFQRAWTPVGVGVKSDEEARELVQNLYPGDALGRAMDKMEAKLCSLPGLEGLGFANTYAVRLLGHASYPNFSHSVRASN